MEWGRGRSLQQMSCDKARGLSALCLGSVCAVLFIFSLSDNARVEICDRIERPELSESNVFLFSAWPCLSMPLMLARLSVYHRVSLWLVDCFGVFLLYPSVALLLYPLSMFPHRRYVLRSLSPATPPPHLLPVFRHINYSSLTQVGFCCCVCLFVCVFWFSFHYPVYCSTVSYFLVRRGPVTIRRLRVVDAQARCADRPIKNQPSLTTRFTSWGSAPATTRSRRSDTPWNSCGASHTSAPGRTPSPRSPECARPWHRWEHDN